jgi:hypothetical protein
VLLCTLIAQCLLTLHQGRSLVNTFSYFTMQSNVLVFARRRLAGSADVPTMRTIRLVAMAHDTTLARSRTAGANAGGIRYNIPEDGVVCLG